MHEELVEKRMKKVKDVILYSRIGTPAFGTSSLDIQENRMREFATKEGLNVVDSVREIGCGYQGEWSRPGLKRVMDKISHVKTLAVMVSDVDRLSKRAGWWCEFIDNTNYRFIVIKHGVYYKTLPLSVAFIMAEENHRQRCESLGVEMERDSSEGWLRFAKHSKPALQLMLDSGLPIEEIEERLKFGSRKFLPCIDGWHWDSEDIQKVLRLG